jgi:hypothetical protein
LRARTTYDNSSLQLACTLYTGKWKRALLLDEFVFLASRSSMLSRMKKPLKIFEKFNALPLLNLEKIAPDEWRETIRGIKRATRLINWIGSIAFFAIGVPFSVPSIALGGIRLLLVDPS